MREAGDDVLLGSRWQNQVLQRRWHHPVQVLGIISHQQADQEVPKAGRLLGVAENSF